MDLYRRVRLACHVDGVSEGAAASRFGISQDHGQEDTGPFGASGLSAQQTAESSKAGPVYIDHRSDPGRGSVGSPQTASYGETDLRAAARRARVRRRADNRQGLRRSPASSQPSVVAAQRRRGQEMFVPLTHAPGHAQADFGEADVVIAGVKQRAHFFVMDLPHSDACFVVAYPAATTEAWLDGHIRAFAFFDGIPLSILYDNDSCLVARILPDGTRHLTQGFSGLQSHYLFKDRYGRPGKGNAELEPWRQWRRESQVKGQSRGSGWLCPAQLHGPDPPVRELCGIECRPRTALQQTPS